MRTKNRAVEILQQYGVELERLASPETIELECYTVTKAVESHDLVAGILPLNVVTNTSNRTITLPAGSYRISMSQPLATPCDSIAGTGIGQWFRQLPRD